MRSFQIADSRNYLNRTDKEEINHINQNKKRRKQPKQKKWESVQIVEIQTNGEFVKNVEEDSVQDVEKIREESKQHSIHVQIVERLTH